MGNGITGLEEELQSDLDRWIKDESKVSELVAKVAFEPKKLNLLELYALAKMAKMPLAEFISGLISDWPEYTWVDDLAEEMPQVLSYLKKMRKGKGTK